MDLSLRQKITIAFLLLILVGGLIWVISENRHHLITQSLYIIDQKSKLANTILEARRYEKNYFLYYDNENLTQTLAYASEAEKIMSQIIEGYGKYTLSKNLDKTLTNLHQYQSSISALQKQQGGSLDPAVTKPSSTQYNWFQQTIRNLGKDITDEVEQMVVQERTHLNTLIKQTRIYLFILTITGGCLCILVGLFLFFSVNQPLKAIEHAIQKIMTGDYTTISLDFKSKEFFSLTSSMNAMITELNRRSEQLIQSKKLASLGTLTSGVAHELNNPLNNISTSIQILLEELEDDNLDFKRELLLETETQVERARDIIKALLEFSRKSDHKPRVVQLKDLVTKTLRLIKGEVPANVEVNAEVPDDLSAMIDPQRIQQVLINLILNGVQAMEDGGLLSIVAKSRPEAKQICIQVRDTGKGIAREELPKIFDPFYTLKEVGKGTGLGLSVSHGIIEQHGGRIEVESELGKGTVFSVFLPTEQNKKEASS